MNDQNTQAALVTGGSRGVGRAISVALANAGYAVAVNHRNSPEQALETLAEIENTGGNGIVLQGDISNDTDCRRIADETAKAFGRLDVLVNNAATTQFVAYDDMETLNAELWDRIFAVNVRGPFQCVRAARDLLKASGNGHVVNITSIAGIDGNGSSIPYCASKAALVNMTQSLAITLAPEVRVNSIAPGFIDTQWTRDGIGEGFDAVCEKHRSRAALQKICFPADVADAVMSLVTGSRLVTGQTLVCDGGSMVAART
jgi:3-oxoacyl-[acyl-carrier protein] reductase